jgi:hypothetical protein
VEQGVWQQDLLLSERDRELEVDLEFETERSGNLTGNLSGNDVSRMRGRCIRIRGEESSIAAGSGHDNGKHPLMERVVGGEPRESRVRRETTAEV